MAYNVGGTFRVYSVIAVKNYVYQKDHIINHRYFCGHRYLPFDQPFWNANGSAPTIQIF